ncbi:MAG: sulfite oxidase, partial [Planctomycetota bacterium]
DLTVCRKDAPGAPAAARGGTGVRETADSLPSLRSDRLLATIAAMTEPASSLSRRTLLKTAAVALPAAGAVSTLTKTAAAQDGAVPNSPVRPVATTGQTPTRAAGGHPGVIVRQWEPRNLEYPLPSLDGPITPTEQFYVRSHFPVPEADAKTWTLTVNKWNGPIRFGNPEYEELTLTLADLEALGTEEKTVTMECAGNGRIFLVPKPSGLLWETGGVGTAVWKGTPLRLVLEKFGVEPPEGQGNSSGSGAFSAYQQMRDKNGTRIFGVPNSHVMLRGADNGKLSKYPAPLHYNRGLPMAKALDDVLLATHMNGESLPPHHGYPLRAIVPGWYGAASVKWLDKITVTNEPDNGFFSTFDYATFVKTPAGEQLTPLTGMQVKSALARPARGERVKAGQPFTCRGVAWAGEEAIEKVEFSADGGENWAEATLIDKPQPQIWTRWRFDWTPPQPGDFTLMSRATDAAGNVQPPAHDPLRRAYMVNFTVPVQVEAV